MQGESTSFGSANKQIMSGTPGGTQYHVQYPAGVMQDSNQGTSDVSRGQPNFLLEEN